MRYNDNALAQHIKPRHLPIDFRTIMQHTIKIKSIKINKQTEYREKVSATSQNKTDIFLIRDDKYIEYQTSFKAQVFFINSKHEYRSPNRRRQRCATSCLAHQQTINRPCQEYLFI